MVSKQMSRRGLKELVRCVVKNGPKLKPAQAYLKYIIRNHVERFFQRFCTVYHVSLTCLKKT
jgi:hypothetical protein